MSSQALSPTTQQALRLLVDAYRMRCLWSLRPDFYPETAEAAQHVLDAVQRHGDLKGFVRSAEIRTWLSQNSSAPSASS